MRQDRDDRSIVLDLAAVLSLAAPALGVVAGGGLDPGSPGDVIAVTAGLWVAAACRAAAVIIARSRRDPARAPVRSRSAPRRRFLPGAAATSPGLR